MVEYNVFVTAKEWLYREVGLGAHRIDIEKLNSLCFELNEAYQTGYSKGYDEGWNDGYNDHANGIRKVLDT